MKNFINCGEPQKLETNIEFVEVAAGYDTSAGISVSGKVYVWGNTRRFGESSEKDKNGVQTYPSEIVFCVRYKPVKIRLGKHISVMLTKSGKLVCWGKFDPKKEKHSREDPRVLSFESIHCAVLDVVVGVGHCCILTSDGVYMMGRDDDSGKMGLLVAKGKMFKRDSVLESRAHQGKSRWSASSSGMSTLRASSNCSR